jgi:glucan biosynthesis protein C
VRTPALTTPARRTDIEALRILVCAMVILLHALLIYGPQPFYHLKSSTPSALAGICAEALRVVAMPLFFIIAGWSAVESMRRRSLAAFLTERSRRVLLPLVSGMVLLCPFIKYIELRGGRDMRPAGFRLIAPFTESFWQFLPHFFGRLASTTWSHLWFLAYLFVLSVLLSPLLLAAARIRPALAVPPFWTLAAPAAALGALVVLVGGYWPYYPNLYGDIGNLGYYAACMGFGALLATWPGFAIRLARSWPILLLAALAGLIGVIGFGETPAGRFCVGATAWCCSAGLLGLAARHPPPDNALLRNFGEATLPVYVLHHLPVLLLGLLLLPMDLPWPAQVAVIWTGGLASSAALYLLLVRPWRIMRVLFGMAAAYPAEKTGGARHVAEPQPSPAFTRTATGPANR